MEWLGDQFRAAVLVGSTTLTRDLTWPRVLWFGALDFHQFHASLHTLGLVGPPVWMSFLSPKLEGRRFPKLLGEMVPLPCPSGERRSIAPTSMACAPSPSWRPLGSQGRVRGRLGRLGDRGEDVRSPESSGLQESQGVSRVEAYGFALRGSGVSENRRILGSQGSGVEAIFGLGMVFEGGQGRTSRLHSGDLRGPSTWME